MDASSQQTVQTLYSLLFMGGFTMFPLLFCSVLSWVILFERLWFYLGLFSRIKTFHLEAMNPLLRSDWVGLRQLCDKQSALPTAQLLQFALERASSTDSRLRQQWEAATERERLLVNQDLKKNLWILGTIGSAAPFIGLFGTVLGILKSFQEMAQKGAGGFTVVAGGISESLVATAAGIVVAVIAVIAYNTLQILSQSLILRTRLSLEECTEFLLPLAALVPEHPGAHETT